MAWSHFVQYILKQKNTVLFAQEHLHCNFFCKEKKPKPQKPWGPRQHMNSHMFTSFFVEELKHYLRRRLVPIQPSLTDHMNILTPLLLTILRLLWIHYIAKSYFYSDGSYKISTNLNVFHAIKTLGFSHHNLCRLLLLMECTTTSVKKSAL